ncbi:hypothetical protein GPLA_1956 [Paraglaciecola polaris LMG 21857]|uniref:Uncharacterized protein n=1 Tax=Paraglaciecola polaris LMG 21857 TaxID=1129793 RepID=K6ZVQ2_9ALTE|nr:hypothetical protein GPLA_1956 [Paraglaciecola polaris LMG 21857]
MEFVNLRIVAFIITVCLYSYKYLSIFLPVNPEKYENKVP